MRLLERSGAVKPVEHDGALDARCLGRQDRVIGGVGPVAKVVDEAMFLRIAVDVGDERGEVAVVVDESAAERLFKEAAGPLVCFVEGLCVGAKQVGKGAAWRTGLVVL